MTAGTAFSEDYDDPDSDVRTAERAAGWRPAAASDEAGGLLGYMTGLTNDRAHGELFEYRSILTDVLGIVLERAGGRRFAELVARHLWAPLGAEHDAEITVDRLRHAPGRRRLLRHAARPGAAGPALRCRAGCVWGARWCRPPGCNDTRVADEECRRRVPRLAGRLRIAVLPGRADVSSTRVTTATSGGCSSPARGVLLAAGIYGQYLYVDMTADIVIAKLSSLPDPLDMEVSADTLAAFAAVVGALG